MKALKVRIIAMRSTPSAQYRQGCLAKLKFTSFPRFDVKLFLQVNTKCKHLFELLSNYDLPMAIKFKVLNHWRKFHELFSMLGIVLLINPHVQLGLQNSRSTALFLLQSCIVTSWTLV